MPIDNRDSARLGKAVEHLVAATCILTSGLQLNVPSKHPLIARIRILGLLAAGAPQPAGESVGGKAIEVLVTGI